MKNQITQNTTLKEILEITGAEKVLEKYNVPCLFCPMAKFEVGNLKIGQVCKLYNIDIEKLLKELNEIQK